MLTQHQEISLTPAASSGGYARTQRYVANINDFVNSKQDIDLDLADEDFLASYPIGFIFLGLGVYLAFRKELKSRAFDKNADSFFLLRRNIFLQEKSTQESLTTVDNIVPIFLKTDSKGNEMYKIILNLKSGGAIRLGLLQKADAMQVVETVKQFIER